MPEPSSEDAESTDPASPTQPDGSPLHLSDEALTIPVPLQEPPAKTVDTPNDAPTTVLSEPMPVLAESKPVTVRPAPTAAKSTPTAAKTAAAESRAQKPQHSTFPFISESPSKPGKDSANARPTQVEIVDSPVLRVHHPSDLVSMLIGLVGVVLTLFFAVYAHATTTGVTQDVQSAVEPAMANLANALLIPVQIIESAALLLMPLAVLIDLAVRRAGRTAIEALVAVAAGLALGWFALFAIESWAPSELVKAFQVLDKGQWVTLISPIPVAVSAMFTVSGRHGRRKVITWAWNMLWTAMGLSVVTGGVTIPAALLVILLGRIIGLAIRYVSGVDSERAYGKDLILGIQRTGIDPAAIVRVTGISMAGTPTNLPGSNGSDAATRALARTNGNRIYAVTTVDGRRVDVVAFDGDRQVISYIARIWRTIRLRAIERRSASSSLRQITERTALLGYSAAAAGVNTPKVLGIAESVDSMFIAQEHPEHCVSLRDLPDDRISDHLIASIWDQVALAHKARLAHRGVSMDTILIGDDDKAWLTTWDTGDVASSALSRRLDVAQTLVMLALRVGVERAVTSARKYYTAEDLAGLGPAIQPVILPVGARDEAKEHKETLDELRGAVVAGFADDEVQPVEFKRKWGPTLMAIMSVIALWVVATTIDFDSIVKAFESDQMQPLWLVVCLAFVLITYLGASLAFVGFSPVPLPLWTTTLVEVAASFVNFVAPAGVGPAALNLRFLTKREVKTSLAVATVALVQLSGFVVTVVLLLVLVLISGNDEALKQLPSGTIIIVVLTLLAVIGGLMTIPKMRNWALSKIMPTIRQVWPLLVKTLGHPVKLSLGLGGNLLMTVGYLAAFWASVEAFGYSLSPVNIALIYLIGNTIGSLSPTPGGLGGVEAALVIGLTTAGIPLGVATSISVIFRVVSYWLRIPMGWFATQYLQKRNEI